MSCAGVCDRVAAAGSSRGAASLPPAIPDCDTAIVWLRRDLRVDDNPALTAALRSAANVVPVYVFAPEEEGQFQPGKCSRWWLKNSLSALQADLEALGSKLVLRRGTESAPVLLDIIKETRASAVFYNHLYDPISLVRDNETKAELVAKGISCYSFNSELLYEPWQITDPSGGAFATFAEFWDKATHMPYPPQPVLPAPTSMPKVQPGVLCMTPEELDLLSEEEEMSSEHLKFKWDTGTDAGMAALHKFLSTKLKSFDRDRAKTDRESTSRLSPHIHYGEISVRRIHHVVKQLEWNWASNGEGGTSCADFLRQMGYREYSRYLSFHFPFTHERSLLEHLRACPWNFDQSLFKAWRQGATGYPLVDAGMLELWSTGWLHNRLRVICASFLVKNLLLPWQWGLKHFWDALLDADVECDALGFQYVSGCLLDAHPFGFMHNIKEESLRFDPDGNYVRRWLPALARLPAKYIHCPSEAPAGVLIDTGVELGINYPMPVVTVEESVKQVAYACEVIAKCCPKPPQYHKEPYYPASDPRLASAIKPEDIQFRTPGLPDDEASISGGSEECCGESEVVASNSYGLKPTPAFSTAGNKRSAAQFVEHAEDDAFGAESQDDAGRSAVPQTVSVNVVGSASGSGSGTQFQQSAGTHSGQPMSRFHSVGQTPSSQADHNKQGHAQGKSREGSTICHPQESAQNATQSVEPDQQQPELERSS